MQEAIGRKHRGWRFGTFEADLDSRELRKHGVRLKLSGQPFRALELLLLNQGEVVTRDELRTALWPGEQFGDYDQRLNKTINKIREALSDSADNPRLLETVPRVGYRFLCPAVPFSLPEPRQAQPDSARPEISTVAIEEPATSRLVPVPPREPEGRLVPGRAVLFTLTAIAVILAIVFGIKLARGPRTSNPRSEQPRPLTTYIGSEQYPQFSPDGKTVVFAWDRGSQSGTHIFTLSVESGELKEITRGETNDYAPVWSPDGSKVAFVRNTGERNPELWIATRAGAEQRKLAALGNAVTLGDNHPITWTKNPRWLITSSRLDGDGPPALYLVSASNGAQRRLTSPSLQSAGDLSPIVSPDGTRLAFTRASTVARRDIYMLQLTGDLSPADDPVRITDLHGVIDTAAWTPDSKELYFAFGSTVSGNRHIAHVKAVGDTSNAEYVETSIEGMHPAVSPSGNLLCYVRTNIEQTSIWRVRVPPGLPSRKPEQERLVSSTRRDYTADLSPDGRQLVFSSVRSGESEIWVSDISGGSLRQLTHKGASTPRWSPEGSRIAYESPTAGAPNIYVFDLNSNHEQRLTFGPGSNLRPSWSRDGKFVYFGSSRTGESQIWRVPSAGGTEAQVTHEGGTYAVEAPDGRAVYFTTPSQPPSVRVKSFDSDEERTVVQGVIGFSSISMGHGGLYYLKSLMPTGATLNFLDFARESSYAIAQIEHPVHHFLSSPPDGSSVLYTEVDRDDRDLMLVNLR